jgi:protein required for attachment to host cells
MPKKAPRTWIVAVDGSRARIFERRGRRGELALVLERDDPNARKRPREIASDRSGRYTGGLGTGRHAMGPESTPHDNFEEAFVRGIGRKIDRAAAAGDFDRVVLIAPPRALGHLRAELSPTTIKRIAAELHKELTALSAHELVSYLEEQADL